MKCYIQIETNVSSYVNNGILNQISFDNSGQWYPMADVFQKVILVETLYKTYNSKFLAIVKVFKPWCHNLEDCKYKLLVLINYNNLYGLIDIKNLSSR